MCIRDRDKRMQTQFKLVIGCDLAAYDFKNRAIEALKARGYDVTDRCV